jgi:hypothetical protein
VKRLIVLVMATMLWPGAVAWSQEVFPDVQYISGRAALPVKIKGSLVLSGSELRFNNDKGESMMVMPFSMIKNVTNSVEQNPGSTGAKIMLGVFASRKEEFLYVNTETTEAAEALVFKVKNKTSPGMIAKIQFQMKKAAAAAAKPAPVTQAAPVDSASLDSAKVR